MTKRYVKKETLTVSRQQEVFVFDDEFQGTVSKYRFLKMLLGDLYSWCLVKIVNFRKDDVDGQSNS